MLRQIKVPLDVYERLLQLKQELEQREQEKRPYANVRITFGSTIRYVLDQYEKSNTLNQKYHKLLKIMRRKAEKDPLFAGSIIAEIIEELNKEKEKEPTNKPITATITCKPSTTPPTPHKNARLRSARRTRT